MGIRTTNLERSFVIDELIGNITDEGVEKTARLSLAALANQLAGTGPFIFGNTVYVLTRAQLDAYIPPNEGVGGVVLNDPNPANNGYYARSAAAWVKGRSFPDTMSLLVNVGGTANAITADLAPGVDPANIVALVLPNPPGTNAAGAVTLTMGGVAYQIKAAAGGSLATGDIIENVGTMFFRVGGEWRQLFSSATGATFDHQGDYNSAQTYTRSQVVTGSNGNWFQSVVPSVSGDDPVGSVTGNWVQILSAGGVGDGMVTPVKLDPTVPAQFRAVIEAVGFDDLPWVPAWDRGVPGDGTDQHVALQTIIDALPVPGGTIMYRGDVNLGSGPLALNLHGRRNIRLSGIPGSGNGTGSGQRSILRSTAGAIGSGVKVIDCSGTFNVSFEHSMVLASNAAFNGVMLDYGSVSAVTPGDDSALMSLRELFFQGLGPTGRMLQLHGSTQGLFENITFSGRGTHLSLQQIGGVGFCNIHKFINCNFKPTGAEYPVSGSAEGILFLGCNIQASSGDGIGRFWRTSLSQPFRGASIIASTFYDVTAAGGIWAELYWGSGLNVHGCMMGGADPSLGGNWGLNLGSGGSGLSEPGVRGFSVIGNSFRYMSGALTFGGTAAADTNAKKGLIAANSVFGGSSPASQLLTSFTEVRDVTYLPNNINSLPNAVGSRAGFSDLPAALTGLNSGTLWRDGAAAGALKMV